MTSSRQWGGLQLSVNWLGSLIYVPTVTYGYELWVSDRNNEITDPSVKISFLAGEAGLSFRDRLRNMNIRRELRVQLLHLHFDSERRSSISWLGRFLASLWTFSRHDQLGEHPEEDPDLAGVITYHLSRHASGSPRSSWKTLPGRGMSGIPCLSRDFLHPSHWASFGVAVPLFYK